VTLNLHGVFESVLTAHLCMLRMWGLGHDFVIWGLKEAKEAEILVDAVQSHALELKTTA